MTTFTIQYDASGDPFLWNVGDMGTFHDSDIAGYRDAATGNPLTGRFNNGVAKFTGGIDASGSPTLAKGVTSLDPSDIPDLNVPWPSAFGPDPRG